MYASVKSKSDDRKIIQVDAKDKSLFVLAELHETDHTDQFEKALPAKFCVQVIRNIAKISQR